MIYFIGILLFGFYVSIDVINYFSSRKISKISFFFLGFAIIQLFLGILTLSQIELNIYEPISLVVTAITILVGILYIIYFFYKKNRFKKINQNTNLNLSTRQYFISRGFSWLMMIIVFIIQLFFSSSDHDSTFYVSISHNFINGGIYSSTGVQGEVIPQFYLYTTSFFLYGTLFQNDVQLAYTVISRIIYLILIFSVLSLIFDNSKIEKKLFGIVLYYIGVIFTSVLFFTEYTGIIGGNFSIQTLSALSFFLLIYYSDKKNISAFFIPLGAAFFSSTAILIAPILIFSGILYRFIKDDGWSIIRFLPILFATIFMAAILFIDPVFDFMVKISSTTNFFIIFFIILIIFSITFFVVIKFIDNKGKFSKIDIYKKINTEKGFLSLITIIAILPILSIIFWWIIPVISSNPSVEFYFAVLSLVPILISIFLFIYSIILWKNKKQIYDLALTFMIFWMVSIIVKIVLTIPIQELENFNNNISAWRISFTFIGFARLEVLFLVWVFLIDVTEQLNFSWYSKKRKSICSIFLTIPFIFLGAIMPPFYMFVGLTTTSNIVSNKKLLTCQEITFLRNIDFNNFSKSYITTAPISPYLLQAVNLTSWMIVGNVGWWSLASGTPKFDISPKDFESRFASFVMKLNSQTLIINSVNNIQIKEIDYIFLSKKSNFFVENLELSKGVGYNEILNGPNISVLKIN